MTSTAQNPIAVDADERREQIATELAQVRELTLQLVEPLSEDALNRVHDPLLSPIVWDLGHIATFEDMWLAQNAFEQDALRDDLGKIYDPFNAPRSERGELPYLRSDDAIAYMDTVRERTLDLLSSADIDDRPESLLARGYAFELVLCHERQHAETILQTLQIMTSEPYLPTRRDQFPAAAAGPEMVPVPGGSIEIGTDELIFSYDNERPRHTTEVADFMIDRTPVTNGAFIEFIEDGGYEREELWDREGWQWLQGQQRRLPRYWAHDGAGYLIRSFGKLEKADPGLPACHVTWYEADAYARFAGKRLPTEFEWEAAAAHDGAGTRRHPWGDEAATEAEANLGQQSFTTAPAGSYPEGASPCGALQLLGDVWEWTASRFDGYPGFRAYPYREYSEEFFGGPYRVLRGGAWATSARAVSNTFRNWDYPQRSQIFAGFRCARNADGQPET